MQTILHHYLSSSLQTQRSQMYVLHKSQNTMQSKTMKKPPTCNKRDSKEHFLQSRSLTSVCIECCRLLCVPYNGVWSSLVISILLSIAMACYFLYGAWCESVSEIERESFVGIVLVRSTYKVPPTSRTLST